MFASEHPAPFTMDAAPPQAFPCNQFGNQEPGTAAEIKNFARERGARFLVMDKIDVNGTRARASTDADADADADKPASSTARFASYQGARHTTSTGSSRQRPEHLT